MSTQQEELAEAAAGLTVQDFRHLEENEMLPEKDADSQKRAHTQEAASESDPSQEESPEKKDSDEKKGKRRNVKHEWPEVGAILEADYKGEHYEAEVISIPRPKTGKGLKILTGPAKGTVCKSMSRAMLEATEQQREEQDLGRSGVSNGWDFWTVKEGGESE